MKGLNHECGAGLPVSASSVSCVIQSPLTLCYHFPYSFTVQSILQRDNCQLGTECTRHGGNRLSSCQRRGGSKVRVFATCKMKTVCHGLGMARY